MISDQCRTSFSYLILTKSVKRFTVLRDTWEYLFMAVCKLNFIVDQYGGKLELPSKDY
jgi:hypothetical protein